MHKARRGIILAALIMTGFGPAWGQATTDGEHFAAPPLADFVVSYQAANAANAIREEVPRGQTVEHWTRMVTTQRFTALAARATPQAYAHTIATSVPRDCPGAAVSPIASLTVSGRAAARFQVDCPHNPEAGGQAETFILLAIAGQSDMHVKQVAFRGAKTAADLAWARGFLDHTVLCRPGEAQAGCR